jgi:hypothetical protein
LKKPITKRLVEWLKVGPEFKPQYHKKKKKKALGSVYVWLSLLWTGGCGKGQQL